MIQRLRSLKINLNTRKVSNNMKCRHSKIQSIQTYLKLYHRPWHVEFGCEDFGASITSLLELPISIYKYQSKEIFIAFLDEILRECSISFILRDSGHIDLAITGSWKMKNIAIPLWIMNDTLIGFEIIPEKSQYQVIDSFPLYWNTPVIHQTSDIVTRSDMSVKIVLDNDIFFGDTIYLKIEQNSLMIANINPSDDLKFFERIASAVIPEIDDD